MRAINRKVARPQPQFAEPDEAKKKIDQNERREENTGKGVNGFRVASTFRLSARLSFV